MQFTFSTAVQALMISGKAVQVISKSGYLLPIARCLVTKRFLEVGKASTGSPLNPLIFPAQLIIGGLQIFQTHSGFKGVRTDLKETQNAINTGVGEIREDIKTVRDDLKNVQAGVDSVIGGLKEMQYDVSNVAEGIKIVQQNLGVLQATTALIGVGTVANLAIGAVSLHQILQLREDVRQMRVEIKDGFIDLKQAFKNQGEEILNYIDQMAQDIKFEQHRLVLIQAYGKFLAATKLMKSAIACDDIKIKDHDLANARQSLVNALGDYRNPHLLSETSALGQLRRMECAWAIEQTIIMTYQIQKQSGAVSNSLNNLQATIRQDIITVSNAVRSQEEMDYIYPEIRRICTQDLEVLASWQQQAEWVRSLPESDLKLLGSSELAEVSLDSTSSLNVLEIPEQQIYDDIKPKSHFDSLRDQLQLMALPELRLKYETYIVEKAQASGHKALKLDALNQSSDMAIANLYHYFQDQQA